MVLSAVALLSLIQGITEFLPVSSTGHLILAERLVGLTTVLGGKQQVIVFEIFIQLGSIFAILAQYWRRLPRRVQPATTSGRNLPQIVLALVVGTLPLVFVGLFLGSYVERYLFNPVTVAWAFIIGGVVMWIVESVKLSARCFDTSKVNWKVALAVGLAQAFAVIPGTSRSGASIIGGLLAGLDRRTATEFSFLLAFPALLAATVYSLVKHHEVISLELWYVLLSGLLLSFLCSWAVMRWLLAFVKRHSFKVFAVYRVLLGMVLLILLE